MHAGFLFVLLIGVLASALISTNAQSSSQSSSASQSSSSSQSGSYQGVSRPNRLSNNEKNRILASGFFHQGSRQVDLGTVFLIALFEKYPEYKEQFPRFKDIPNYCLLNNKQFRQVSAGYTAALNDLVRSVLLEDISNVELWRRYPCPLAASGYSQKDKDVVQDTFISTQICNQDNFSQADVDVWNKAWSIIWRNYVAGAREAQVISQ